MEYKSQDGDDKVNRSAYDHDEVVINDNMYDEEDK